MEPDLAHFLAQNSSVRSSSEGAPFWIKTTIPF